MQIKNLCNCTKCYFSVYWSKCEEFMGFLYAKYLNTGEKLSKTLFTYNFMVYFFCIVIIAWVRKFLKLCDFLMGKNKILPISRKMGRNKVVNS